MENKLLWYQILSYFDRKGYFSNGLTIPFLLGANSVIDTEEERHTVEKFFEEIVDESLPQKISLQKCENIGEYVIGIFDNESVSYPYGKKSIYKQFGNLYITDNSFAVIEHSDDIKKSLVEKYQYLLDKGLFSINQREWKNYSEKEKSQLKELKINT